MQLQAPWGCSHCNSSKGAGCAGSNREEGKQAWYLEWKEVKRQMGCDEKEMEKKGQRIKQVQEIFKECQVQALHNDGGRTTKVY